MYAFVMLSWISHKRINKKDSKVIIPLKSDDHICDYKYIYIHVDDYIILPV